jgi:hypothetical protein
MVLLFCLAVALPGAFAEQSQFGTAADARAMLEKAVAAVHADETKALDMFATGEGGFLNRDIYPFCFNISDSTLHPNANPNAKGVFGKDLRNNKDAAGKACGLELYAAAQKPEGQITEVSYMFVRPGSDIPVQKVSLVTRVGDLGCGVGYYK